MNRTGQTPKAPLRSEIVVLGSDDPATFRNELSRLAAFLAAAPEARLCDIAFTCATESAGKPFKVAIVATSPEDLAEKLQFATERIEAGVVRNSFNRGIYVGTGQCPAPGRTVFLFPGEGTQYPDMMRELALQFPACRAAFDAADTAVASVSSDSGTPVWPPPSHYVFPPSQSPQKGFDIRSLPTPLAIQTVLAADTAMLFLFEQLGIAPDATMGVGVGELVALECAGAIQLPAKRNRIRLLGEGYRLIAEINSNRKSVGDRATFSVAAPSRDFLQKILASFKDDAIVFADQTPELFTVSIATSARPDVEAALAAAGITFHPLLSIDKPFHTRLMEPFAHRFHDFYAEFVTAIPHIPVYSCSTRAPITGESPDDIAATAARQWTTPLDVSGTIHRLYDDGFRVFVELGARGGLTACVSAALRHLPHLAVATNRGHRPDLLQLHHALAALVSHGANFDPAILHKERGSRLLDFSRPGDCRPPRRRAGRPIPSAMPTLADVIPPPGLVANAAPDATAPVREGGDTPGAADFPCLDFAEVVRFSPEEEIELSFRLSRADFPYLLARSLSAGPVSAYDKSSRGLTPPPVELLAEIMAEAARKLCPDLVVIRIEDLHSSTSLAALETTSPDIHVKASRSSVRNGETKIAAMAAIRGQANAEENALASCAIVLAAEYPAAPSPAPLPLRGSLRTSWTHEDIYPARLASGECCRAIKSIPEIGENGLAAECFTPPRRGILRSLGQPRFSTSPVILATASDALALLHSREPASGSLHIFSGAAKIEFFAAPLREWTPFSLRIATRPASQDPHAIEADAEVSDDDHRTVLRVTALSNRAIGIPRSLHRLLLDPISASLSEEVPAESLPALPHEVICRKIEDDWPDDEDDALRLRIAAGLALTPRELERWADLPDSRTRRHEWLFGRVAAKDAVRKCLAARYGRQIGAADIAIEADEAGKPFPQGPWRKTCGAPMDISITHTPGCVVAAAAPNAALGIDAERASRALSEDFATFAFSQIEQEMAAESGDGATALFRFWCAKEALSKALGSGLRYGPNDLSAQSLDVPTGKVEMSATRLWLEAFPQLRGVAVPVHTCLLGDIVMAVCSLDRSLSPR